MNTNRKIELINYNMNVLKSEYIKIKKNLAKLFYKNCLDALSDNERSEIADSFSYWYNTACDMSEEALRTHLDIDEHIAELIKQADKFSKKNINEQKKVIRNLTDLVETAHNFSTLVKNAWDETSLLWAKAIKKMRIEPNEELVSLDEKLDGYKIVFAEPIIDFCVDLVDKENVEIGNLQNDALNRCIMVDGYGCPVVLQNFEIELIKELAKTHNLTCNFIEWTPENCAHILIENGQPKTVFKELESEINLL